MTTASLDPVNIPAIIAEVKRLRCGHGAALKEDVWWCCDCGSFFGASPRLATELERAEKRIAELVAALEPFAAMPSGEVPDPHPCLTRCWRIGDASAVTAGVCVECGMKTRPAHQRPPSIECTYGDIRVARAALATRGAK